MENLITGTEARLFWCWVDHDYMLADHNYRFVGSFTSVHPESTDCLMFQPNAAFSGFISPFQYRLLSGYMAEYNLELSRRQFFPQYPSRLTAIFLFENETDAMVYKDRHFEHVGGRVLRKAQSNGPWMLSKHDSVWVDFLRLDGWKETQTLNESTRCYWKGIPVDQCDLQSLGKPWTASRITEILFNGRIDFIKEGQELPAQGNQGIPPGTLALGTPYRKTGGVPPGTD